jgi:methylthioribose-1-phosphate isomerase
MSHTDDKTLLAIKYDYISNTLLILDQLLLPNKTVYISVDNMQDAHDVIKNMQVGHKI